jgi:hypothetical protein
MYSDSTKESVFTSDLLNFIFENIESEKIYTHYTHNEEVARLIMDEGFKFNDSFYKTTQNIQNDIIVLNYKHNLYEHYGEYMIIICLPDDLTDYVKNEINLSKHNLTVEDYISKTQQNAEDHYLLPPIFVKGYIKYKTGEIIPNPKFKFNYSLYEFKKHLFPLG